MKVKEVVEENKLNKVLQTLFENYGETLDEFIQLQLPRPSQFENITTESDFDDRYEFQEWVRDEVSQPFGRFILDDMGLAYSLDLFSHIKSLEARDWYATAWGDILEEVIWHAYEFEAPVVLNYKDFMEGVFQHFIDYHGDIELECYER